MMSRKPDPLLLEKHMVKIKSDTVFRSHARLLQSIWREEKAYPIGEYKRKNQTAKLGNLLEESFAKNNKANFLTETIGDIVEKEVSNEVKLIQTPRVWNNLLSSQPLAFNLFGELKQNDFKIATSLFKRLLGEEEVEMVTDIEFEFSPGRNDPQYTNDKTASDVFVTYKSPFGSSKFVGIEVKYAEDMRGGKSSHKPHYEKVAKAMDIFKLDSKIDVLINSNIQQIWRDHLLAGSMFVTNKLYEEGNFMIIFPEGNIQCINAIDKYKDTFEPNITKSNFHDVTLEKVIGEIETVSQAEWITDFKNRYLDFSNLLNRASSL